MIRIGGIYRVVPMDPGDAAALVLATALDEVTQSVAVTLLSPDLELGGSADLVLTPDDSGLAYSLLLESDIFGYAWVVQLDREVGRVSSEVLDALGRVRDEDMVGRAVAGPPIVERSDPRWNFKLQELRRLQALTAHCTRDLVDGERSATIDPEALRVPRTEDEVAAFEEFVLEVIEGVRRGDTMVPGWLVDLALDESLVAAYRSAGCFHVLRTLWTVADASSVVAEPSNISSGDWRAYRAEQVETLASSGTTSWWLLTRSTNVVGPVEVRRERTRDGRVLQVALFSKYERVAA